MFRCIVSVALMSAFVGIVLGAEKTYSEKAIAKAITVLEAERDKAEDLLEQARIDKAIRDLEALIEEPEKDSKPVHTPKPSTGKFVVKPAVVKKKFGAKSAFNPKTGELTLVYDFAQKSQLADFDTQSVKPQLVKGVLMISGGDSLPHVAKFRSVTVSVNMVLKSMSGSGISSSSGTQFKVGGDSPDQFYFVIDGEKAGAEVSEDLRTGTNQVSLELSPIGVGVHYARGGIKEKFTKNKEAAHKDDVHQLTFVGGSEGCGFSNLIITGIPDPEWFKTFLSE